MNQILLTRGSNKLIWLVFSLVLGWPVHGSAWGPEAHRIVGLIADQHLQPEVRKRIKQDFNITSLANVANWADRVRDKSRRARGIMRTFLKARELM